ncbi:DNA repair protein rad16 [Diaporthe eres]|uniref:DNA repair protein rad16 n=1 Tax=Diaporthe eres TaxID=83184 RepID=A0ABR1PR72_DIAER
MKTSHSLGTRKSPDVYIKQEPTSGTADVPANATPSTVNPINDMPNVSVMADEELSAYLAHYKEEEDRLPKKEAEGLLTEFYSRQRKQIRHNIKMLEGERSLRQSILSSALNSSKSLGLGKLPVMQVTDAQRSSSLRQKRKPNNNEGPNKRLKITKETRQIKDTVMRGAFSLIKGDTSAAYDKDATKTLPQISEAPTHLRDHLQAIQNAALQNPGVNKDIVDHDIRAFAGILPMFGSSIQPWVSPGDGPKTVADFKWRLTSMSEPLHHHQVPAIGIMLINEKVELKSGLLFDYMGLGKTVEILGCIVMNPPVFRKGNRSKRGHTTTLIVVPKSAVLQWEKEVQRHCQDLKVGIYDKESEADSEETLSNDILIVTYDQLRAADRMAGLKKKKQKRNPRTSLLFKSNFYRVCLDEAHKVKGRDTETFRLCCKLQATHRWCASGTPTPNGIAEIYSYLRFIKHPLVKEFPTFRDQYLGGKKGKLFPEGVENKYEKLDRLLEQIMLMRCPGHKFLGGALLELPETQFYATPVELSAEEDVIYKSVEAHIEAYINNKSGKKPKTKPSRSRKKAQNESSKAPDEDMSEGLGYRSLYEVALRLRQLVASPLLLEKLVKGGIWTAIQVGEMRDEAYSRGCVKTPFIDQFESWLAEPKLPQATSRKASRSQRKTAEAIRDCSGSGDPDNERPRMRGEDFLKFAPKEDFETSLFRHLDANPEAEIPLSSKMRATLDQIQGWQSIAPQDKLVVFSQFIDIQRLLGRVLQDHGIEFLYFMGEMDYNQREAAKEHFRTNPDIKVMRKEVHAVRLLAENTVDTRMYQMQQTKIDQVTTALERFQEDKSFGLRALRRVLGVRFLKQGDEDDEALFKDQDEIEDDDEYYSAEEDRPRDEIDEDGED